MSQPQTQLGPSVALDLAPARRFRFSLRMMFGITTMICLSLAVGIIDPGLGSFIGFILTPALVRASAGLAIHRKASEPVDLGGLVIAIAGSVVAGVALSTTFLCIQMGAVAFAIKSDMGVFIWTGISLAIATVAGSCIFWKLWPNPDARRRR